MTEVYVANCRPSNWQACVRDTIFGIKTTSPVPRRLPVPGDIILFRISGTLPNYGVTAIWYLNEFLDVQKERISVPWNDADYKWFLKCTSIVRLPRFFCEEFQGQQGSKKIRGFPQSRIQPALIHLKVEEREDYINGILRELSEFIDIEFDYQGNRRKSLDFVKQLKHSQDVAGAVGEIRDSGPLMSTYERALQIYQILVGAAHDRRILTYELVGEMVGLPPMSLGAHLTHLMNWCHKNHLPPITVLVVQKDSGKPGEGFTSFEDLHRDRERVFAHDWFKMKPLTVDDLKER